MKIENKENISIANPCKNDSLPSKDDAGKQAGKTTEQQFDRVELSTRKAEVEKLEKAINDLPDVRSEKVAKLKKQIVDGTYHVESTKVAEKILAGRKGTNDSGGTR
jgi:flagellar biosynthesis anti-sigma factor FlgM